MALTTSEIESLRHHLGYGNIGAAGAPYSPDTFLELFSQVVSPNLSTGTETSATTAIAAGATVSVTPVSMTGILAYGTLVVDVGDEAEAVVVKAVSGSAFTAKFAKAHASTGYPVATMSGLARLRLLLWDADASWRSMTDWALTDQAGVKRADEVEFFGGGWYLKDRVGHYRSIVSSIASLVQVPPKWASGGRGSSRLEAY